MNNIPLSHSVGPMDLNNFAMIVSTLITSYLMQKYNFGTMYYGMAHGITLQTILYLLSRNFDTFNFTYLIYIPFMLAAMAVPYILYYYKKQTVTTVISSEYLTINIYSSDNIITFTDYVTANQKYYDVMVNTNIGDLDKVYESKLYTDTRVSEHDLNMISKMPEVPIKFDDQYLGIKGYYVWKKNMKQTTDKDKNVLKDISFKYVELNILKEKDKNINPEEIFSKMSSYMTDLNKNKIVLNYIKVLNLGNSGAGNHTVEFYRGEKQPFEVLETKYIKTLFHPERDRLWSIIKNCCMNYDFYRDCGQVGRVSLLLHGPPGTGKSTFAYRIAMCLNRHIISLDLRISDKAQIYQILQNPRSCGSYKNAVFLFEEFDISIQNLYHKEKKNKKVETEYFDMMTKTYTSSTPIVETNKSIDEKKDPWITNYKTSQSDFSIRDLLEIFQGPIPFEGMVMLASTNKYDEIKELCPELFRPGRLTPIHFGYIDKDTLQDISKFYFNKKIGWRIPDQITIPTSQIIELALEAKHISKKPFEYFSEKLEKLL